MCLPCRSFFASWGEGGVSLAVRAGAAELAGVCCGARRSAADHQVVQRRRMYGALIGAATSRVLCAPAAAAAAAVAAAVADAVEAMVVVTAAAAAGNGGGPPLLPAVLDVLTCLAATTLTDGVVAVGLAGSPGVCGCRLRPQRDGGERRLTDGGAVGGRGAPTGRGTAIHARCRPYGNEFAPRLMHNKNDLGMCLIAALLMHQKNDLGMCLTQRHSRLGIASDTRDPVLPTALSRPCPRDRRTQW